MIDHRPFSPHEAVWLLVPVLCLLSAAAAWSFQNRPFQDMIAYYTSPIAHRSAAQRQNIQAAVSRLDGVVIGPGDRCSFNELVGPRTIDRGFAPANAFMEGTRTRTLGGGICQVSSTLYAALQGTTLPIRQRVPHFAVVNSVPPGRDATVWYGQADLAWQNSYDRPIKLKTKLDALSLRVELWGTSRANQKAPLRFSYRYGHDRRQRLVQVYRHIDGHNVLLSQDVYRLW